ncbi:MAG: hypothetical protein LBB66_11090 [Desulfovibrio sp.]|nr:hypothetical protein [Desulfovibrio sp.]
MRADARVREAYLGDAA